MVLDPDWLGQEKLDIHGQPRCLLQLVDSFGDTLDFTEGKGRSKLELWLADLLGLEQNLRANSVLLDLFNVQVLKEILVGQLDVVRHFDHVVVDVRQCQQNQVKVVFNEDAGLRWRARRDTEPLGKVLVIFTWQIAVGHIVDADSQPVGVDDVEPSFCCVVCHLLIDGSDVLNTLVHVANVAT